MHRRGAIIKNRGTYYYLGSAKPAVMPAGTLPIVLSIYSSTTYQYYKGSVPGVVSLPGITAGLALLHIVVVVVLLHAYG